jgi:cyclopropane-fatty-acyl-phospholipid synthase
MNFLDGMTERAVRQRMQRLTRGHLTLHYAGSTHRYGPGGGPSAVMTVHDAAFFRSLVFGGHIGAAESYVRGEWTADDLTGLIQIFAANREVLDGLETGWARLSRPLHAALRFMNRNTRSGSTRNVRAHYDLSNDFFRSFLDETMTYSCGVFADDGTSMRDASIAKYQLICHKLDLGPEDHVIEIGSGWGGFAIYAASTFGCRVTTTTISAEQHRAAQDKVAEAGLQDSVTVLLRDYRDLEGTYDKLVSIEMVEAVGHHYLDTYFDTCASLLKPDGLAAIQAITIQDHWYDPKQRQVDFIKRYIFPGSFIPAVSTLSSSAARTDLRLVDLEDLTPHYAETLRRWRAAFSENWPQIQSLGFDEEFRRLWEFYFCYCEGGFAEAVLGSVQAVFAKPFSKGSLRAPAPEIRMEVVA